MHFHIQLSKSGEKPKFEITKYYLQSAKNTLNHLLNKELICTENHDHDKIKCYVYDYPLLSAKISDNHSIWGEKVDHASIHECMDVNCYRKMDTDSFSNIMHQ